MISLVQTSLALLASSALALAEVGSRANTPAARWYKPLDNFVGRDFLNGFDFYTGNDPTHGRVNYVNKQTAQSQNLTFTNSNTFIMRADYKKTLSSTGPGRDSVRIQSKKAYGQSILIANVRSMPQGCGTWPALWSNANGVTWPNGGEVDIIEGVNDQAASNSVLHTGWGCEMEFDSTAMSGTSGNKVCTSSQGSNAGCIAQPQQNASSFGPNFNQVGGGWYAVERTNSFINMWFWARNDPSVPTEVRHAGFPSEKAIASEINPATWGKPYGVFSNKAGCDMSKFKAQNVIINLTLCGDWAGNSYPSTCPKTCNSHVEQDPADFEKAMWNIASLSIWSPASAPPKPSTPPSTHTYRTKRSRHHNRRAEHQPLHEESVNI